MVRRFKRGHRWARFMARARAHTRVFAHTRARVRAHTPHTHLASTAARRRYRIALRLATDICRRRFLLSERLQKGHVLGQPFGRHGTLVVCVHRVDRVLQHATRSRRYAQSVARTRPRVCPSPPRRSAWLGAWGWCVGSSGGRQGHGSWRARAHPHACSRTLAHVFAQTHAPGFHCRSAMSHRPLRPLWVPQGAARRSGVKWVTHLREFDPSRCLAAVSGRGRRWIR